jgi:hypothetical protein
VRVVELPHMACELLPDVRVPHVMKSWVCPRINLIWPSQKAAIGLKGIVFVKEVGLSSLKEAIQDESIVIWCFC